MYQIPSQSEFQHLSVEKTGKSPELSPYEHAENDSEHFERPIAYPFPTTEFPTPHPYVPPRTPPQKKGGWQPIIVLLDSLIILGAAAFAFYAQRSGLAFTQTAFAGQIINSSNVSAVISGVGTVIAAVYVWTLALLGRMWLYKRVSRGSPVELGQLMAIASRGSIDQIQHCVRSPISDIVISAHVIPVLLVQSGGSVLRYGLGHLLVHSRSILWGPQPNLDKVVRTCHRTGSLLPDSGWRR